jgi:hypothetical protein
MKQDATKTLRELVLVSEDTEFDCHLQCHHGASLFSPLHNYAYLPVIDFDPCFPFHPVAMMGDLNFRLQETPNFIVQAVRDSISWEVEAHSRRRRGREHVGGPGRDQKERVGWRDVRHACFRIPAAAKAARRAEEAAAVAAVERGQDGAAAVSMEAATASLNAATPGGAKAGKGDGGAEAAVAMGEEEEEEEEAAVDERAVAAEWEEGGEEIELEGGGEGQNGVQDSEVDKAQRTSHMLKSARAWNWLTEMEELSIQMREGRLFYGFQVCVGV